MSIYVIGIDPGISGGIVALNNGHIVDITSMPSTPTLLWEHFRYLGFPMISQRDECHCFIENVHSMPTDGVHSAFVFGQGLGRLEGVLAATGLGEALKVKSSVWMEYFGLKRDKASKDDPNKHEEPKYDYKKRIKQKALDSIPSSEKKWKEKINLKTCDAYLIALYGYKSLQNAKVFSEV